MTPEKPGTYGLIKNLAGLFIIAELFAMAELAVVPLVYVLIRWRQSRGFMSELGLLLQSSGSTSSLRNLAWFWSLSTIIVIIIVIARFVLPGRVRQYLKNSAAVPGALTLGAFSFALHLFSLSGSLPGPLKETFFILNGGVIFVAWLVLMFFWGRRGGICFAVFSGLGFFIAITISRCLLVLYSVHAGAARLSLLLFFNLIFFLLCAGLGRISDKRVSGSWKFLKTASALVLLGFGVLLISRPAFSWVHYYFAGAQGSGKPNVVMVVMDTVRADHLSLYGYSRDTTPFLEKLSEKSVVFENAFSASPWTLPSHASFFTGLLPSEHNCTYENMNLSPKFPALAQRLKDMGYFTIGWSNNPLLNPSSGILRGFDRFVENSQLGIYSGELALKIVLSKFPRFSSDNGARFANRTIFTWLSRMSANKKPFFLFVNYMEAHTPYVTDPAGYRYFQNPEQAQRNYSSPNWDDYNCHPPKNEDARTAAIKWYDGSIYYLDFEIGKLYDRLSALGLAENTIFIVLSDHGESFGEHEFWGHGITLFNSELKVPLLISYPRLLKAQRLWNTYSLKELPGDVLKLVEGRVPEKISAPSATFHEIFAEVFTPVTYIERFSQYCPGYDVSKLDRRQKAVIAGPYKLIWDSKNGEAFYEFFADPDEAVDLKKSLPQFRASLHESMKRFLAEHPFSSQPHKIDSATDNALKALGYIR